MSDFKAIETQEDFDKAIADRLARAEKTIKEQFADYDQVKKQNNEYLQRIETLSKTVKDNEAKNLETAKTIEDLNAKIQGYETDSAKTRITLELGLPYDLAKRLNGSTEEEIRKDAESLLDIVGRTKTPAPAGTTEPDSYATDNKSKALKELAQNMKF